MKESKYFGQSETVTLKRSEIHPSDYNPRVIDEEGKKQLKRSIKRYGVIGGIVVNKQTGNTIVGGHQKVAILDELNKYPEKDYDVKVELVDVDEKTEKEMNVMLNNPHVGGSWDWDKMRELVGSVDFDYKNAGLTEQDLDIIGVDYLLQTDEEANISNEFDNLLKERDEQHRAELDARREQRDAEREAERLLKAENEPSDNDEKIARMKEVKQQVKEQAIRTAADMSAYVMLSFDTWENKVVFMEKFGYQVNQKIIKGEIFDAKCEPILDEE